MELTTTAFVKNDNLSKCTYAKMSRFSHSNGNPISKTNYYWLKHQIKQYAISN